MVVDLITAFVDAAVRHYLTQRVRPGRRVDDWHVEDGVIVIRWSEA